MTENYFTGTFFKLCCCLGGAHLVLAPSIVRAVQGQWFTKQVY